VKYQVFLYVLLTYSFSYSMDVFDGRYMVALNMPATTTPSRVLSTTSEVQTRLAQEKKIVNAEKEKVDSSGQRFKQVRRMG
jgi:hypothetical protein